VSRDLCQKAGYTYTFLSDPKAEIIRRYDLLHAGAGENGQDIARPGEFLLDSSGVIRWVNLTGDYRVRARPEQIIEQAKKLRQAGAPAPSSRTIDTGDENTAHLPAISTTGKTAGFL
jgi:peroxiredoxin